MNSDAAKPFQDKINSLHEALHKELAKTSGELNREKNLIIKNRQAFIKEAIEKGEAPKTFWADALIALLTTFSSGEQSPHFLGPYDKKLLTDYLDYVDVTYRIPGKDEDAEDEVPSQVKLLFRPNPFFSETELWAKDSEEGWVFSGVTWSSGHGPRPEPEEEEGGKRPREEEAEANATLTEGPTVLEMFGHMGPHPEDDSELEDYEEDEVLDLADQWEDELDERDALFSSIQQRLMLDPLKCLDEAKIVMEAEERAKEALKRLKPEEA